VGNPGDIGGGLGLIGTPSEIIETSAAVIIMRALVGAPRLLFAVIPGSPVLLAFSTGGVYVPLGILIRGTAGGQGGRGDENQGYFLGTLHATVLLKSGLADRSIYILFKKIVK
jgi:hypothetical protein